MRKQKENTILYTLRHGCDDMTNDVTRKTYARGASGFAIFLRENGINKLSKLQDPEEWLQKYADALADKRPSTIHTYLAGAAHALGRSLGRRFRLQDIQKPIRSGSIKGRDPMMNHQGRMEELTNKKLMEYASCVGLRRSEYKQIVGCSYRPDESGYMCIWVKGKGGKIQAQRILPWAVPVVNEMMAALEKTEKLFSKSDLKNKIDLHKARRQVARKAYEFYKYRIDNEPGYTERLRNELLERYRNLHPHGRKNADMRAYEVFEDNIYTRRYKCRGKNAQRLKDQGRDITFNRLAVMAVSVFHLSHWRADVTITNYLV